MQILNTHEREFTLPAAPVGILIDSLASANDRLWPRHSWPAMRFDRPLGIGADGGHGPIRYRVDEYNPRLYISFRFTEPKGFDGHHAFEVISLSDHSTLLRHSVKMHTRGLARWSWPLLFEPLHDALLEDALATGEAALGLTPTVHDWSIWVRCLRWMLSWGKARPQVTPDILQRVMKPSG